MHDENWKSVEKYFMMNSEIHFMQELSAPYHFSNFRILCIVMPALVCTIILTNFKDSGIFRSLFSGPVVSLDFSQII